MQSPAESKAMATLLAEFPKKRPALSKAVSDLYVEQYRSNRQGDTRASSLAQWAESWMHKKVARHGLPAQRRLSTLEIGAGTLNQLLHEPEEQDYDIVEPFGELYADSPLLTRIRNRYDEIWTVPEDSRYDRIISIATFEHLCDLPAIVALCGRYLQERGVLQVAIPSEGTFLWSLGWRLTTGLEFRLRHNLDYGELIRHEHVNQAWEIETVLRCFFKKISCSFFGLNRSVSLYQYFRCQQPDTARCAEYLKSSTAAGNGS